MLNRLSIVSRDGTRISCHLRGEGPPLVLVHGTSGTHTGFALVEPHLTEKFTVVAIDRRGHGTSGDSHDAYTIVREFEDVAAIVDTFDEPVSLFGHSYGALVALGAAPLAQNLSQLVLYEPPCGVINVSNAFLDRLDALAARGELETLLEEFLIDFVGVEPELLDAERAQPDWATRAAAAATIARELRTAREWKPNATDFRELRTSTVLLLGSESPDWARQGTENTRALIRGSRVVFLEGQGHIATATAPELLARNIAECAGQ